MASIGFVGLGVMGLPMATRLAGAGHRVVGFSRGSKNRKRAAAAGLELADNAGGVANGADVVITMLPDTPDVEAIALGPDGVIAGMRPEAVFVDMSTIQPSTARALHAAGAEAGVAVLDAPVSGGEAGALAGELSIMVGGEADALASVTPVLQAIGTTIVLVGGPGSGQVVKAANQMMVAAHLQSLAEALVFLRAHEVDLESATTVLAGGLAGSTVLNRKKRAFLDADFTPGFRLALHHKDLGIAAQAARRAGVALPLAGLIGQLVQATIARGAGELDHSALYDLTLELNGHSSNGSHL
ncbi:NAD(P)-dependent oxidoreductase [Nakamurella flavida]|uniref:NAD(P)-dependent oxidoreductase n=2 Tax=Nakamurella flavida TaxID=363630 RepID=A0A938YKK0_9ACTN|nr:NAD(P)-dependent oxidoreductase [Nakamurella flavida]MBM9476403.1 NAD(P)-dependent oxidoreductase [Nakamurella flavida]MDP9779496.1 2-hydroxy-3-oxopropionate reductase [Nakamurella flavida]